MLSPSQLVKRMGVGGGLVPFFKCVCVYFAAGGGGGAPSAGAVAAKVAPILCLVLFVLARHGPTMTQKSGVVRAAHRAGAGAVGAGRRAAGVPAAAGGGHGGVRGRALRLHRRVPVRRGGAGVGAGRGATRGHGGVRARAAAAARAGGRRARVRRAAGRHGVARRRAGRLRRVRRDALPALRRHLVLQPLRGARALQSGAGDVHVLPGPAGHRAQRAGPRPRAVRTRRRARRARTRARRRARTRARTRAATCGGARLGGEGNRDVQIAGCATGLFSPNPKTWTKS